MACPFATERVWTEKARYHDAEKDYFEHLSKLLKGDNIEKIIVNKSDFQISNITSPTDNNNTNIMQDQQFDQQKHQQQPTTVKAKKTKKDKNRHAKQQQNDELKKITTDDTPQCDDTSTNENSSSINNAITNSNGNVDDDTKAKKKRKKKNKTSPSSDTNKINENNQNHKITNNNNGNSTPTVPTNITTTDFTAGATLNQDDDQKGQNNKKQQRPAIRNLKGSVLGSNQSTLVSEIAKARQHIKNSLEKMDGIAALAASPASSPAQDVIERLASFERENATLRQMIEALKKSQAESDKRIKALETKLENLSLSSSLLGGQSSTKKPSPIQPVTKSAVKEDDDDGVDLFASDSEEEDIEAVKIREQRLAEYAAKKSKKPALVAKSNVILDVKPWDDETDLNQMEAEIRKITTDGLLWGTSKFKPVAFGIQKLTISCVVEDEKVSIDWLTEEIEKLEDYVQSVDVAAFNKI